MNDDIVLPNPENLILEASKTKSPINLKFFGSFKMSPLQFLKEVKEELDRVTWPSKEEVVEATFGVVVFCAFIAVYFWLTDFVFSKILEFIIAK